MPAAAEHPTRPTRYDIAISGAGFAGLTLARALRQALGPEFKIALIDRQSRSEAPADARAFALGASSKRMLEALGVWPHVAADAQPVTAIEITDSSLGDGVRPVLVRYDNEIDAAEPATYILPAHVLETALARIVSQDTVTAWIAPATATTTTADDHAVTLSFENNAPISAPLLVGAEGRKSATRDAAGIKTIGWTYGQTAIVTTIAHSLPHNGRAIQHFLPAGPFALLPLTGDRCCITWSEDEREAARILALADDAFLAEIDTRVAGRLGDISLAGPRQSWPLELRLARTYRSPRIAIIGDAAHGVHPIAGQGLNLAFRDIAALAEVIAETARAGFDIGNMEALGRYERWRRFDSTISAAAYDGLNRLFSNDNTLLRAVRDFGLGLVDRAPRVKELLVAEGAGTSGELPRLLRGVPV